MPLSTSAPPNPQSRETSRAPLFPSRPREPQREERRGEAAATRAMTPYVAHVASASPFPWRMRPRLPPTTVSSPSPRRTQPHHPLPGTANSSSPIRLRKCVLPPHLAVHPGARDLFILSPRRAQPRLPLHRPPRLPLHRPRPWLPHHRHRQHRDTC